MNIKTRLTLTMWALPMAFIMVTMGTTAGVILTGSALILIHAVLWVNLLGEIEEKKK